MVPTCPVSEAPRDIDWRWQLILAPPSAAGIPDWMLERSHAHVGDLAETIALLLDAGNAVHTERPLAEWVDVLRAPRDADETRVVERLAQWWHALPRMECFLLNKLLTCSLRVGVSAGLATRALAAAIEQDENLVAQRLIGGGGSRGLRAEACRRALHARPQARRVVEVEGRSAHRRRGAGLRQGRPRPALEPVHRLHAGGLGWRGAGAGGQGLLGPDRCRTLRDGPQVPRRHTVERFGPVRSVRPEQVFGIAFENIPPSSRHKAGLALRFPRIHRWRQDKPAAEAGTPDELRGLLNAKA